MTRQVAIALLASGAVAGCGTSSSSPTTADSTQTASSSTASTAAASPALVASKPSSLCISGHGYGGIGASVSAFKNQNPTAVNPPPSHYQDGIAFYEIKATKNGCVSEYTITEATTPTQSIRDLLSLVTGIGLPNDAQQLVNQDRCGVWSSASLARATGRRYAVGYVTVPPEADATGIVDMAVSASPQC